MFHVGFNQMMQRLVVCYIDPTPNNPKVLYENGVNGMLADEMGLGKTVQTIALLCHLVEKGVKGPFLVVAPLSTLCNWCNEIKMFAPQLPYVLFHGNEDVRREKMKLFNKTSPVTVTLPDGSSVTHNVCPIVVTSYEIAILSHRLLSPYQWRYLAVDEGHRIKNYECRLAKCLKNYKCPSRLLLTGTPLQNSLAELWSLLNFLLPMVFDSLDVFESWFDVTNMANDDAELRIVKQEEESRIISTLHQILSPFLLRMGELFYLKVMLEKDLAVFKEHEGMVEEVTYDSKGRPIRRCATQGAGRVKALLDGMHLDSPVGLDRFLAALQLFQPASDGLPEKETKSKLRVRLQNRMMQCRRVVNHPYLISYPLTPDGQYKVDEELVSSCGKLQVLDQLLQELYSRGHKVLLFSQMTKLLDILHDYLTLRPQYSYLRLDGSVSLEDRQADIDSFNKDSDVFLFLLSTRAGSLGINLTAADTVIIYDSDWNPQQDLQAQDRCHRIGQTKPVLVLRLVTAASIDEKIVERANSKRCLEKLIMKAGRFKQVKDRYWLLGVRASQGQVLAAWCKSKSRTGIGCMV
ncbi:lymphocyte-specific helicase [Hyalella azteca]|uniref:Proliferation-associated SNF2-like protein n=1 Tax=Hyalella azteca TaxID=294128 RepID=A0A979FM45_HYAAZ|nr:lymphocyte-specific helicase [Hyalella azteca]